MRIQHLFSFFLVLCCAGVLQAQSANDQLIRASLTGDMGAAMAALGAGADPNTKADMGKTPLMLASKLGHTPLVIVLIDRGGTVDGRDAEGTTALMYAARNGQYDPASVLIEKGAKMETTDKNGLTPLMMAAENGNHEIMGLLLEKGAKPQFTKAEDLEETNTGVAADDRNGQLLNAILNHKTDVARQALQAGAEPNARSKKKIPALVMAASRKQVEIVQAIIDAGGDVNIRATDKSKGIAQITPLHVAAANGNSDILRILLTSGALVNAQEKTGLTPLMSAAELGNIVNVILLLDHGAEINSQDYDGASALLFAVERGNFDAARILLSKGADVDLADQTFTTPLMLAAQSGNREMVELLLENGANPKQRRGSNGYRAADFAKLNGFKDIAKLLKEAMK